MLRADVIVGGLLGDEGKGKYVGAVCHDYDAVLRVMASTNAGHCVSDGVGHWVTRQLPSVFFPRRTQLILAPGALLNLPALADELAGRPDLDALAGKVHVASSVSLVLRPYIEKGQGPMSQIIGSTHQGTGPSAVARAARHSLRLHDVRAAAAGEDARRAVLEKIERTCRETLPQRFERADPDNDRYYGEVLGENLEAFARVERLVGDFCVDYTALLLSELRGRSRRVLVEGCNGLLLDNLHGALPHVTSTSTNIGAMLTGANLAPADIDRVIVVIAAYATCLGKRPFPTELAAADAAHFHARCNEIDVAESQPRRIGWVDLPALRKALAGACGAELHLNKLDVLSGLSELSICTHYTIDGQRCEVMPDDPDQVRRAAAGYLTIAGWDDPLGEARRLADLPAAAQRYVSTLAEHLPNPITSIGVGPRNQDIIHLS